MNGLEGVLVKFFFELDLFMGVYSRLLVGVGRLDLFLGLRDTFIPFSLFDLTFSFPW
jgi:hypothetical protein